MYESKYVTGYGGIDNYKRRIVKQEQTTFSSSKKSIVQLAELWWKEHPSTHYWESN